MRELVEDKIYEILTKTYDELLLDYVLLSFDEEYHRVESHRKAIIKAIDVFNNRVRVGNSFKHPHYYVDEEKMQCKQYGVEDFFCDSNSSWKISGNTKVRTTPDYMTYWWAFMEPPYGVPYSKEDFHKINNICFQFNSEMSWIF